MRSSLVAPSRRALALRVLALACLLAGYADLARGGMTVGPLILVLAYVALVPAALLVA